MHDGAWRQPAKTRRSGFFSIAAIDYPLAPKRSLTRGCSDFQLGRPMVVQRFESFAMPQESDWSGPCQRRICRSNVKDDFQLSLLPRLSMRRVLKLPGCDRNFLESLNGKSLIL